MKRSVSAIVSTLFAALAVPALGAQSFAVLDNVSRTAGDNLSTSLFSEKAVALTKDGLLYAAGRFTTAAGPLEMRLYRSGDGGSSFSLDTRVRTTPSAHVSMVTGTDGFTLHVIWMSQQSGTVWSVLHAPYNTRTRQWVGPDQVVWQGGATGNDFIYPDIDLLPDGNPVACLHHRSRFRL